MFLLVSGSKLPARKTGKAVEMNSDEKPKKSEETTATSAESGCGPDMCVGINQERRCHH